MLSNPFDPKQEAYFEGRLGLKMQGSPAGQVKWYKLWWSQGKECPGCNNRIDRESGWFTGFSRSPKAGRTLPPTK